MKLNQAQTAAIAVMVILTPVAARAGYVDLYSTLPDLTVTPDYNGFCSDCNSSGFRVYDLMSFAQGVTINSLAFDVETDFGDAPGHDRFATMINVSIFSNDAGQPGTLLFNETFVSGTNAGGYSYVDQLDNVSTVTVAGLDSQLSGGDYWLSFSGATGPSNLGVPAYDSGADAAILQMPDGSYLPLGLSTGFQVQGAFIVPEPATWALMLIGVGAVGVGLRRTRSSRTANAV